MTTWINLPPIAAPPWTLYNAAPFGTPTVTSGGVAISYPQSGGGGYAGASCPTFFDAPNVGDPVFDYDLTYANVGADSFDFFVKVYYGDASSTQTTVSSYYDANYYGNGPTYHTEFTFAGSRIVIVTPATRLPRIRGRRTAAGYVMDGFDGTAWHAAPEMVLASAQFVGLRTEVGLTATGNTQAGVGTLTFAVHQSAPAGPTITSLAVSLASSTVAGGDTVQATATATLSDNSTRAATSSEVTWTESAGPGVNASGLATAPGATQSTQTVTVTATRVGTPGMTASATYTVPAATLPTGTPAIRVRDGVTVLTSGATVDLGMQAGAAIKRRWFVVDNGASGSTDAALTGLAAAITVSAPWLAVSLDYTTAAAVLSLAATSPATVPSTAYAATAVSITSTVANVPAFTLNVVGTVAAADTGALLIGQLDARSQRADAMMTALLAGIATLADQDALTRTSLATVPVPVQAGSADAIASKTQAAVGSQLTAIGTAATGAQTAAQTAATAAGTAASAAQSTQTAVGFIPAAPSASVVAAAVVGKQHDTEAFHALGTDGQPIAAAQTLRLQRTMPDGSPGHQIIYADANGATLGQSAVLAGA